MQMHLLLATVLSLAIIAVLLPARASAAECTDTWTGPAEGSWATASNWSAKHVPTESDVACIGSGKTTTVSGASRAALVQGEGGVNIAGGSLELIRPPGEGLSTIGSLAMSGGSLKGPGTLEVQTSFVASGGKAFSGMWGSGETILGPGAVSEVNASSNYGLTVNEGRRLVNEGTMTVSSGFVEENNGGVVENTGTFKANAESPEATVKQGGTGGGAVLFVNRGTFEKTAGTGTTRVSAPFENRAGQVDVATGNINFSGGGSSSGTNSLSVAEGSKAIFGGGTFSIGSGTSLTGAAEVTAGTVNASSLTVAGTVKLVGGTFNVSGVSEFGGLSISGGLATAILQGGTTTVKSLTMSGGSLKGAGMLEVQSAFAATGTTVFSGMWGSGETILGPGAVSEVNASSNYGLTVNEGRRLVNEGTMTVSSGFVEENNGGVVENTGTFKANAESPEATVKQGGTGGGAVLFVNRGTFEKTAGTGTTRVSAPFENRGQIVEASGKLNIEHKVTAKASTATPHHSSCGDPVDCGTGNFTESQSDLEIGGRGVGLDLTRTYSAQAAAASSLGIFGYGWTNSFGDHLASEEGGAKETLTEASGGTVTFTKSGASYTAPGWSLDTLAGGAEAGFTLTLPDQTQEKFSGSGRLESVTDRNGNATTLAYNGSGRLETITDPSGRKITLAYNGEGLVEKAKDPMGHEVKYAYESKNLKSVTLPGESAPNWQFKYDGSHRMTSMTDGRGGKTTNEYDSSSRVISQTDPAGRTTTWSYEAFDTTITNKATGAVTDERFNSNNQPYSITRGYGTASATTETFSYTAAGLLASRTDGDGHTTSYGYEANGNRTSERDPEGDETKRTFNGAHELLTETNPSGEKTTIVRDTNGNPETVSRPAPESKTQTVSYEYGPHGELESMTDPLGRVWAYGYDKYGDRTSETDPEGDERTWAYNEDSQVTSTVSPRGNEEGAEATKFTTTIERDAQGRPIKITDPLGGTTKRAYDADGNIESITDPNGHKTKFTYDADNERTKVELPNGTVEETGYDGAGAVTSQIDGDKQKTTYVRDVLEQPVEIIDPLERKTVQTFDAAGNLKTRTDPDGRVTTYGYDKANRLKEVSYSAEPGQDATYAYNEDGEPTSMKDATGESTWEYDQLGRLIHSKNGHGETVSWVWNLGDEPVGLTYPNGKSIVRAYDKVGRLESVTDWLGHTTSFGYNRDSEPTATTFPVGTGDSDEFGYDRADRMASVAMKKGAETLASLAYTRDPAEQLESLVSKGLPGAEEESFGYDENERLTKAGAAEFGYDAANNITKAPGTTNAFDKASQIESATGATFTFDKEGERTKETPSSGPATTYKYDQAGSLAAVERTEEGETQAISESLGYDGFGQFASRTIGLSTTHFVWDPTESPELLLSDGADSYVYGPGGLPVEQVSNEEVPTYLHHDQLGSTRLLTNSSGEVAGTLTYGAYGALTGHTGSATTALGYSGQYTLGQSGLLYLRARYYDPATAQFLTRDPALRITRQPYDYAGDNPLRFYDRTGRAAEFAEGGCPPPICYPFPTTAEAESAAGAIAGIPGEVGEFGGEVASSVGGFFGSIFGGSESDEAAQSKESEPCAEPLPPGHNPDTWERRPGSREGSGEHWWDPEGGEWGWHAPDKHHPEGHWDYNPWREWNDEWQNIFP
jgi:RHS repeat-associated protein